MMRPPSPASAHDRRSGAAGCEGAVQVDADDAIPELGGEAGDGLPVAQPGVGDDDVEPPDALDGLGHQAIDRDGIGHVGGEQRRAAAELLDLAHAAEALVGDRRGR